MSYYLLTCCSNSLLLAALIFSTSALRIPFLNLSTHSEIDLHIINQSHTRPLRVYQTQQCYELDVKELSLWHRKIIANLLFSNFKTFSKNKSLYRFPNPTTMFKNTPEILIKTYGLQKKFKNVTVAQQ